MSWSTFPLRSRPHRLWPHYSCGFRAAALGRH